MNAVVPITRRSHCPGPWHEASASDYATFGGIAPELVAGWYGITSDQLRAVYRWVKAKRRTRPCPV